MMTTTADTEGPEWSARASAWAEHWGDFARPAAERLLAETDVGAGAPLLDVGCGSGELCALAAGRGAFVSGIDAAPGMIAIARRRLPGADLRVGPMEHLPWPADAFDAVTGVNALQFAADAEQALAEIARVVRPGGRVGLASWGPMEQRELFTVFRAVGELEPPTAEDGPPRPQLGAPGALADLARTAGLRPLREGTVDIPYSPPDLATLQRAVLEGAGFSSAVAHAGEETIAATIESAAAPFRRPDGSYCFDNVFAYLIAEV